MIIRDNASEKHRFQTTQRAELVNVSLQRQMRWQWYYQSLKKWQCSWCQYHPKWHTHTHTQMISKQRKHRNIYIYTNPSPHLHTKQTKGNPPLHTSSLNAEHTCKQNMTTQQQDKVVQHLWMRDQPAVWSNASPLRQQGPGWGNTSRRISCWCPSWMGSTRSRSGTTGLEWTPLYSHW